ncbi:MAG: hypothetical protein KGY74_09150 [Candidatus Cloacimonetes bacterium]|nr:hypothetical protein [Candidatus Cloacimonadota bacterium]
MKLKIIIILSTTILTISIFQNCNLSSSKEYDQNKNTTSSSTINSNINKDNYKKLIFLQYQMLGKNISDIVPKKDYNFINKKDYIVVFIPKEECGACIMKTIMDLSLIKQENKFDNILLLGCFNDANNFNQFIDKYDNEFYHKNITLKSHLIKSIDRHIVLYIKNEKIQHVYIPEFLPDIRTKFFHKILSKQINNPN